MKLIVLSHYQTAPVLAASRAGARSARMSLDLELTTDDVSLDESGVHFPDGQSLTWQDLGAIDASERGCFVVEDNAPRKIQFFSQQTNQLYSLMPTRRAPTMLISGLPMHRIKDTDPHADTLDKVRTVAPVLGRVLDTATGLGYTAIQAARSAQHVTTIELDPAALAVARLNPWSASLFENLKITQVIGDSFEEIEKFEADSFTRIIHDPPMFSLAGDLYSGEFYRQLFRVLQPGGRLFHYLGDPASKSGHAVTTGAVRRLQAAGFRRVAYKPAAFGVVAYK